MTEVKQRNINPEKLERVAEVLKTIAHPVRLSILEVLESYGRLTVSDLKEKTKTEQSLLSHHLIKMKDKGVLKANRQGKNIYYQLADTQITKIFDCMENCSFI